jgi:hypothetical protein
MEKVTVGLRDGFNNDEVVISVNGKVVTRATGITTNPVVSFAKNIVVELPQYPSEIQIQIPSRDRSASATVGSGTAYLAVFLHGENLSVQAMKEPLPIM